MAGRELPCGRQMDRQLKRLSRKLTSIRTQIGRSSRTSSVQARTTQRWSSLGPYIIIIIIIMLKTISCSSLRLLYLMTDTSIGSTTVQSKSGMYSFVSRLSQRRGFQTGLQFSISPKNLRFLFFRGRIMRSLRYSSMLRESHYVRKTSLTSPPRKAKM